MADALYRSPDIGATNPTIYYYDEPTVIWSAGGTVDGRTGIAYQRRLEEVDRGQALPEMDVDYGIGAALLIRRETLEKAGLLDPSFFLYFEETDWCFRARECGYRVVYVPSAKIWHKVSRSMRGASELSLYYFCRNRLLFLKNRRTSRARLLRIAALEFGRMSAAYAIHGEQKQSRAVRRAVFDFFNRRFGKVSL
jgi:GT2 family glycosyltransferase